MTVFRLTFAGEIKRVESRMAGDKPIMEVSICKKNRGKPSEDPVFTWVRVTIWSPAAFQVNKIIKGAFIAGSGEMMMRSYEVEGVKRSSLEVSCQSFDVEVSGDAGQAPEQESRVAHRKVPAPATSADTESDPPF